MQWNDFLQLKTLLPRFVTGLYIGQQKSALEIVTPYMEMDIPTDTLSASLLTEISLGVSFYWDKSHTSANMNFGSIVVKNKSPNEKKIVLMQYKKPSENLQDSYQAGWNQVVNKYSPFDGRVFRDKTLAIGKVIQKGNLDTNAYNYALFVYQDPADGGRESQLYKDMEWVSVGTRVKVDVE